LRELEEHGGERLGDRPEIVERDQSARGADGVAGTSLEAPVDVKIVEV
jgi:hypothetical protein